MAAASEGTLYMALSLFNNLEFRGVRALEHPNTRPEWDARAATFAAMDAEGKFDGRGNGQPMSSHESEEFELISAAVLHMSHDS